MVVVCVLRRLGHNLRGPPRIHTDCRSTEVWIHLAPPPSKLLPWGGPIQQPGHPGGGIFHQHGEGFNKHRRRSANTGSLSPYLGGGGGMFHQPKKNISLSEKETRPSSHPLGVVGVQFFKNFPEDLFPRNGCLWPRRVFCTCSCFWS